MPSKHDLTQEICRLRGVMRLAIELLEQDGYQDTSRAYGLLCDEMASSDKATPTDTIPGNKPKTNRGG